MGDRRVELQNHNQQKKGTQMKDIKEFDYFWYKDNGELVHTSLEEIPIESEASKYCLTVQQACAILWGKKNAGVLRMSNYEFCRKIIKCAIDNGMGERFETLWTTHLPFIQQGKATYLATTDEKEGNGGERLQKILGIRWYNPANRSLLAEKTDVIFLQEHNLHIPASFSS